MQTRQASRLAWLGRPHPCLLNYPGNQVQTVLGRGRALLEVITADLFRHGIGTQAQGDFGNLVDRMGQGLNARGVDSLHFFDQRENIIQLSQRLLRLAFG